MLPASKSKRSSLLGWVVAGLLIFVAVFMWIERQLVIDVVQYAQFTPSSSIEEVTMKLELTDKGKFLFYASHPVIEDRQRFNEHCERREARSPILGCYGNRRIFIYNVTDKRLDGLKEVTAAHELLHAVYERMSAAEKAELEPLLQSAYERLATDSLRARMAYYEKTEPGETYNELHAILPTEFADIGDKLNDYYKKYFTDRKRIVALHAKVDGVFTQLADEADQLIAQMNTLADSVNRSTQQYNAGVAQLNQQVESFNARASQPGGFGSQAEFGAERARLEAWRNELETLRQRINSDTAAYKQLQIQLEATNSETESLNSSIDSVLSDEPKI